MPAHVVLIRECRPSRNTAGCIVARRAVLLLVSITWMWSAQLAATTVHAQEPVQTTELQPQAAAPQAYEERRHTGLLIGGAITFANSYVVTAVVAAMLGVVNASDCEAGNIVESCDDSRLMLIPLVGPFLTDESVTFQLALAGPQILGALLAVAGVFHYSSRSQQRRERIGLTVHPVPLPAGGALSATLTF